MKNLFSVITFLFLSIGLSLYAQQLPNYQFEDWTGATFDGEAQPASWNYSNVTQFGFKFNFAHKETGHNGGSCIMMQDQALKVMGIGETSPGYIALGQPWVYIESLSKVSEATAGTHGGISWKYRPDTMAVWIKRTGSDAMSEDFHLLFYTWKGTAHGDKYKGKNESCTAVSLDDEESDIRQSTDGNECGTTTAANQVAEGWYRARAVYKDWVQIKVPIYYINNEVPDKMNVIFSASNYPNFRANSGLYVGNSLYVDDVQLIYSSKIQQLFIGGTEWKNFNPNSNKVQYYVLGDDATTIPEIKAYRGMGQLTNTKNITTKFLGRQLQGQEISITQGEIDKTPTTITVRAEDGSSTTTYQILFMHSASNNAKLDGIQVNGQSIKNFSPNISDYIVEVVYGSKDLPVISVTTQEEGQTVEFEQPTSLQDVTVITVTAPDHSATKTYTIRYKEALLDDNTLKGIMVNGATIPNFIPTKTNYVVNLPLGTTDIPDVVAVSNYADGLQTITLVPPTKVEGGVYKISVTTAGNAIPMVYQLRFKLVQSANCQLQGIFLNGTALENFTPDSTSYQVTLPQGTTSLPQITYTSGDAFQTVEVQTSQIKGIVHIIVTSISGNKMVYKITYVNAPTPENKLLSIYIAELDSTILLTDPTQKLFDIALPPRTNSFTVSYQKNYDEQTIIMQPGGINNSTLLIVYPNKSDNTPVTYTLRPQTTNNAAVLTDIKVDGKSIAGFRSNQFSYIVNRSSANSTPYIQIVCDKSVTTKKEQNLWSSKITVTTASDTNTYHLYFHYPNDSIPNGEFTKWTTAKYNSAEKPVGWNMLADYFDKCDSWKLVCLGSNSSDEHLEKEGNDKVHLITEYKCNMARAVPSFITLGTISGSYNTSANFNVSGGINFHNSPDQLLFNYKQDGIAYNNLIRFEMTGNKGYYLKDIKDNQTSDYTTHTLDLGTINDSIGHPSTLNITFNSYYSFVGDLGSGKTSASMYIDWVRFTYNNTLTSVFVNGKEAFRQGNAFSLTLPTTEDINNPKLSFKGEVDDQAQSVAWEPNQTEDNYIVRRATITNYGEDGKSSQYQLTLRRPMDTNSKLKDIKIGGQSLPQFKASQFVYTYGLSLGSEAFPDVIPELANAKQTCTVSLTNATVSIQVKAENGEESTYTIRFVYPPLLSMIYYNSNKVPYFYEGSESYAIQLKENETMWPAITYMKKDSNQIVDIRYVDSTATAYLNVYTSDFSLQRIYSLTFLPYKSNNARLKALHIEQHTIPFADTIFLYKDIELDSLYIPTITYTLADARQSVILDTTYFYNTDSTSCIISININVTAEDQINSETYTIQFSYLYSNTLLQNLFIRSHPLDTALGFTCNFDPEQLHYFITYPVGYNPELFFNNTCIDALAQDTSALVILSTDTLRSIPDTAGVEVTIETCINIVVQKNDKQRTYTIHQKLLLDSLNHTTRLLIANSFGEMDTLPHFEATTYYYEYKLSDTQNNAPEIALQYSNTSSRFAYAGIERSNNSRVVDGDDNTNYALDNSSNDPTYHISYTAENGTKYVYKVKFQRSAIKRAQIPMEGDVLVQHIPGTCQIAVASLRANVLFSLYDMSGRMVETVKLEESDPNSLAITTDGFGQTYFGHLTDFSSCTIITLEPSKIYFWTFTENGKRKIKSGKMVILP